MDITNIGSFFNRYIYDNTTGEITFYSIDGTREKTIELYKDFNIKDCDGLTPDVYYDKAVNAANGSFALTDNNTKIYYRVNGIWELIFSYSSSNVFRLEYYNENKTYNENNVVGYKGKKYASTVDNNNTTPTDFLYSYKDNNSREPINTELDNILGLHLFGGDLIITTSSGLFRYNSNGVGLVVDNLFLGKAVTIFDSIVVFSGSTVTVNAENGVTSRIDVGDTISDISSDGYFVYASIPSLNLIYKIDIQSMTKIVYESVSLEQSDTIYISNDIIYITKPSQQMISIIDKVNNLTHSTQIDNDFTQIVSGINGDSFALTDNGIVKFNAMSSLWKSITLFDMLMSADCPNSEMELSTVYLSTTNATRNKYVHQYNNNVVDFYFVGNSYLLTINNRTVYKTDIKDGIMLPKYTGESFSYNENITGVVIFGSKIVLSSGQKFIILNFNTMTIEKEIDLQNKIEDSEILSLSRLGDTLYALTTNGKVYMFDNVGNNPVDIVALEMYTNESKILATDSQTLFVTNATPGDTGIWILSSTDGSKIGKTLVNRGIDVSIGMAYGDLYTIDIGKTGRIIRYNKEVG